MEVKPGYKQTDVGMIPDEWEAGRLEDYFSFISYGFTNPMPTVEYGIYLITAADISGGRIQYDTARHTTEVAYRTLLTPKSKPKKDDILLTKDGSLGRLALVGNEVICINQSVAVIRPNEKVEPVFLKLLLESPRYQKRMLEDAGGSTIRHIYITIVNLMPIAVPKSHAEQHAIAAALSDVDALIGALDQLIAKKRDLKQAAMQQLLTGEQRLPGFGAANWGYKQTEVGAIPAEWETKKLGEFVRLQRGHDLTEHERHPGAVPVMSAAGQYGFHDTAIAVGPGVVIGRSGASFGQVHWCGTDYWPHNTALYVTDFCGNDPRFAFYFLKAQDFSRFNTGGAQPSLNRNFIYPIPVGVPQLPEQQAIATVLSDMDAEIAALEARRDKTRALKQGMMQELLTGRIRLL